jgi:hypothetical protein
MRDVLFDLASSYKLMNPIRGIVAGFPFGRKDNLNTIEDEIDQQLKTENTGWQKHVTKYVKAGITPKSWYKLKKFMDDEMLNKT